MEIKGGAVSDSGVITVALGDVDAQQITDWALTIYK